MRTILLSVLLFSCGNSFLSNMENWEVFKSTGLLEENENFRQMIFVSDSVGYLFGKNETDENILRKNFHLAKGVIYRTKDAGRNWEKVHTSISRFQDAVYSEGTFFALSVRSSHETFAIIDSSFLYAGKSDGSKWDLIHKFPLFVREVRFNRELGLLIAENKRNDNSVWQVKASKDNGRSWNDIFREKEIKNPIIRNDSIWYLAIRNSKQVIICRDFKGEIISTELVPNNAHMSFFESSGTFDFFLCGTLRDKLVMLRRSPNGKYSNVNFPDSEGVFPVFLNVQGANISLVIGEIRGSIVEHKLYISGDSGLNWNKHNFAISTYVNPVSVYKQSIWTYSGGGRIQYRKGE